MSRKLKTLIAASSEVEHDALELRYDKEEVGSLFSIMSSCKGSQKYLWHLSRLVTHQHMVTASDCSDAKSRSLAKWLEFGKAESD